MRGLEGPGRDDRGNAQRRRHIAARDSAGRQDIARRSLVELHRVRRRGGLHIQERGERLPGDRELRVGDPRDRLAVTDQRGDGFAPVSDVAVRQHRLVLPGRIAAKPVLARDIGGDQDPDQSRVRRVERRQVPDGEPGMGMGRADRT